MKIVFFGTPEFTLPALNKILSSSHELAAVVTVPDKEKGRGRKVGFSPVKEFALEHNIPVLQPEKLKDELFIEALKQINADVFVVVAFRILPKEVYSIPSAGSFNLHGSLLPRYRGAAPIQWAIINGETETGVTTFFLEDKVDTGKIIDFVKIPINNVDNLGTLHDKMAETGADLILKTLDNIEKGDIKLKTQDDTEATPAPKITKDTCRIDWNNNAVKINNLIRGLSPYPAAFFENEGKTYKVYNSEITEEIRLPAGKIQATKKEIFIGTEDKTIKILEIQPEGRKRMTAEEFLRGYSF